MRHTHSRLAAGCVLAALAVGTGGCARTQDPAQAGFFSGTANLVDGTYDRRIAEREAALASVRASSSQLQAELAASRAEATQLGQQEAQLQQRLYALDAENAALRQQIAYARQQALADEASLRGMEAHLAELERRRTVLQSSNVPNPAMQAEVAQLEREIGEINRAIDDIMAANQVIE